METTQFELIVPTELAAELAADSHLTVTSRPLTARDRAEYRLSLDTLAAVITVVAGVAELGSITVRLAERILTWRRSRQGSGNDSVHITIIGDRADAVVPIRADTQEDDLAAHIRRTISEPSGDTEA